jgi:hypothetical protein
VAKSRIPRIGNREWPTFTFLEDLGRVFAEQAD